MNFFYLFALAEQIRITFAASSQKSGLMVAQERAPSKDREIEGSNPLQLAF